MYMALSIGAVIDNFKISNTVMKTSGFFPNQFLASQLQLSSMSSSYRCFGLDSSPYVGHTGLVTE